MSEAWFGRQLARHPPADRQEHNGPARPLAGPAPPPRHGQPEPVRPARPELTRPAGIALIITGAVLLQAVSIPLPFLNVKLLGLIMLATGLVKVRALQRASSWLWRNRRDVQAARVSLDTLPEANAPVARPAGSPAARTQRRRRSGARGGQRLEQQRHHRRTGAEQPAGGRFTVTVIVPAYNEEDGIRGTLDALMQQTDRPERIIVVDDCSQDSTGAVAREYGVEVLRPPHNLGSKAKAQNYALPYCATDLVLPVDADTILAADYVERIKWPFEDPRVVIAAGNVQTKVTGTVTERGRSIEYLTVFHFYRPIQNRAGAPVVCSGCCCIPRFGPGWKFTIVEGATLAQLSDGPGHVTGTQFPGQPGNFAVAAHDITAGNPFLHLGDLRPGNVISATTKCNVYRYAVQSKRVVRYTDIAVLDPVPGRPGKRPQKQLITLITCTPVTLAFTPYRIIVTGHLVRVTQRVPGAGGVASAAGSRRS